MMDMSVNVDPDNVDNIKEDVTCDSRGRLTLGAEFAGETVTVAVLARDKDE